MQGWICNALQLQTGQLLSNLFWHCDQPSLSASVYTHIKLLNASFTIYLSFREIPC